MSHFLRHGTICSIRREIGDWRVIDERFDGHVHQYLMQSLNNGAIAWRFLHEITEKDSSTYQEINDFLNSVANDFDEDLFEFVQPSTMKHENNCNTEDVHVNCHENRFKPVTTSSLESLKDCNTEVTTKKQTKWAVKMLKDYMMEARYTTTDFEMLSVEDLDQLLEQFYAALQSKTGKDYSKQTLVAIRAGLNRHLTSLPFSRKLSLMRDRDFAESNKVLSGKIKTLKREGKDFSQHKEPISDSDLAKLYSSGVFSLDNPSSLQKKVLFEVIAQFGRRGREGIHSLQKNSFVVAVDADGDRYIKMAYNEADKTHHGVDAKENIKQPRMYEQKGNEHCPVLSFEKYIEKLNPNCNRLFQRPLNKYANRSVWYANAPIGINTVNNLMPNLSKEAGLSVRYTNHCIRAMVSSKLHRAGFSASSIMSVTGHRNVQSLCHYIKPSDNERKQLSSHLSYGKCNKSETIVDLSSNNAASSETYPVPSLKPPVLTQQSDNAQFSTTCSTQSMSVSKSVDVRQSGNISAFHMFSGNVSSSTINVYCTANPFENRN